MRKFIQPIVCLVLFSSTCFLQPRRISAENSNVTITYELNDGRFGDQLLCYLHGKWMSYFHGLPFLYKPFMHSEEFMLHEKEKALWTKEKEASFDQIVFHRKDRKPTNSSENSLLYVIPFFSEHPNDLKYHEDWFDFLVDVNWMDPKFRLILREMFSPRKQLPTISFPTDKNYLTVALHVRKGGGHDIESAFLLWPLRFPPDSYFIECLTKLCKLFPNRSIYAYVFTDDPDPKQIVSSLQSALTDLPIVFDCRKEGNHHNAHVIEDFFAMMNFDCLIRSHSNFSLIPAIITDYEVVMTPKHSTWKLGRHSCGSHVINYIDEIEVDIRKAPLPSECVASQ